MGKTQLVSLRERRIIKPPGLNESQGNYVSHLSRGKHPDSELVALPCVLEPNNHVSLKVPYQSRLMDGGREYKETHLKKLFKKFYPMLTFLSPLWRWDPRLVEVRTEEVRSTVCGVIGFGKTSEQGGYS